jgi:hypothetical protein
MLTKNTPKDSFYSILFSRMILDGVAGTQFIFQGKFSHFSAILKAHYSFYTLFSSTYKKRGSFQTKKYYNIKSIVFQYHVNRGKVFVR